MLWVGQLFSPIRQSLTAYEKEREAACLDWAGALTVTLELPHAPAVVYDSLGEGKKSESKYFRVVRSKRRGRQYPGDNTPICTQ